jgi:class 3 adenylate cyclase/tetratricopeptide (TPR) repeat protein
VRVVRKTVTVVFADLVGSTALGERSDPEVLQERMTRYHAELRTILERHGGTVEKFIGDAAMAVFGIPQAHEDDALRAVRAAAEIKEAMTQLELETRIGVNTGEVVAGEGETLVTGDAVNVAARLEQAASPGEILIGARTERLVRDAVRTKAVEPLELKGKADPVPAHLLLELLPDVPAFTRVIDTPFVGRERELETLEHALASAIDPRSPQLATIVGPPGIGKSRLARELIQRSDARVLVGRCLSYGEGITYWPLREIVSQVGDLRAALGGEEDAELAATRIEAALGKGTASSEEIAWGFRKLFEALAREMPLILFLDDIHWAEPTLLDLIEYVSTFGSDAPLLLLASARADLFELRPAWATPKPNASLVTLGPLGAEQTEALVDELQDVPEEARARIVEVAEGNPLFVEQLVAIQAESGDDRFEIPPTVQALLAARIDRLAPEERAVIERASVEGRQFHRGAVQELLPEAVRAGVGSHLMALVRKEFIRPDRSELPGDDGFRFGHILIRDAAYASIPKKLRAELHERFANLVESRMGADAPEEIVGYHLEQAHRYRIELGSVGRESRALARRGAARLRAGGGRASARGDMAAAANLFGRAVELLPADDTERLELLPDWAAALIEAGELARATAVLEHAAETAEAAGHERVEWRARLGKATAQVWMGGSQREAAALAERAAEAFALIGDELGLARAWNLVGLTRFWLGSTATAEAAWHSAIEHARRAGSLREEVQALSWLLIGGWTGPTPVDTGIDRCRETLAGSPPRQVEAMALLEQGPLLAMRGDFAEGRELFRRGKEMLEDLGLAIHAAGASQECFEMEMLAGDPSAAEAELRDACAVLERLGEKGFLSTRAAFLAHAICAQGRYEEAEPFVEIAAEVGAEDDLGTQAIWRSALAKVRAAEGAFGTAEKLAREAVEIVAPTDWLNLRGATLLDLAEVLRAAGRPVEAREALEDAIRLFGQKGNVVEAHRAGEALAELG